MLSIFCPSRVSTEKSNFTIPAPPENNHHPCAMILHMKEALHYHDFISTATLFPHPFALCLLASNKHTPALTDTFKLSTLPSIGMRTSWSHVSRVRRRKPSPSAPSTQASPPLWRKPCKSVSSSL